MGIMDRIGSLLRGGTGKRAQNIIGDASPDDVFGMITKMLHGRTPPKRGSRELLLAYQTMPWLNLAVRRRADALAAVEWEVYASSSSSYARQLPGVGQGDPVERRAAINTLVKQGKLTRLDASPLIDLLQRPNRSMTGRALWRLTSKCHDLVGESFWIIERGNRGIPEELWYSSPYWTLKTPSYKQQWYEMQNQTWRAQIPEQDVIWMRDHDPHQPYDRGIGAGMVLGDELETDEYAAKMAKFRFYNRMDPTVMLSIEGIGDADLTKFIKEFEHKHKGVESAGLWHFFNKKVTATPVTQTMVEASYIEARKLSRDMITQVIGVAPEVLGIVENSNRATIEAADYLQAKYSTTPECEFICSELNAWLVPEFGQNMLLGYVNPIPEDVDRQNEIMKTVPWAFMVDEHRERGGHEPLPGGSGKVFVVPAGMGAITSFNQLQPPSAGLLGMPQANALDAHVANVTGGAMTSATPLLAALLGAGGAATAAAPPLLQPRWANADAREALLVVTRALQPSDIDLIVHSVEADDMGEPLEPVVRKLLVDWGQRSVAEINKGTEFDGGDPRVDQYVNDFVRDSLGKQINGTTKSALRQALIDAMADGTDPSDAVRTVFADANDARANLIAVNTTVQTVEYAKLVAYDQTGITEREWIATPDGRTRDEHWDLDGQIVKLTEPFHVEEGPFAGATAMNPGGFGIAALDINCRCTTAPVTSTAEARLSPENRRMYWRATEEQRKRSYADLERAVSRGFSKQRRRVLAAIAAAQE